MTRLESAGGHVAELTPIGPDADDEARIERRLLDGPLRDWVAGARTRWLSFRPLHPPKGRGSEPTEFEAVLYDYTHDRALEVRGPLDDLDRAEVTAVATQPLPTLAEFREAVAILTDDPEYGPHLIAGRLVAYRPMPPLLPAELGDGRSQRVVTVGVRAPDPDATRELLGDAVHAVVGVNLSSGEVQSDSVGPAHVDCAAPIEDDDCPDTGDAGTVELVVTAPDGTELWRLAVVRPAASSGTNNSGVELLDVRHRGRSVLGQAHVPILNVDYQEDEAPCGPTYRDWLGEEACFEAFGEDLIPGFRLCSERPRTMIEAGFDGGNFRGVAVFFDGDDLLLVSELQAGWYRYMTEWRLVADGTIRPRFGFSAIANVCTCRTHVHHAYYRLDFDIDDTGLNSVEEFNADDGDPVFGREWTTVPIELSRERDPESERRWRVARGGASCEILPGPSDGTADLYGGSDAWFLQFHEGEIDDGQGFTTSRVRSRQRIDLFANGEIIQNRDVVVWYALHWAHVDEELGDEVGVFIGPDLVCSWGEEPTEPTTTTSSSTTTSTTTTMPGGGGSGGGSGTGGGGSGSGSGGSGGGSGAGGGGSS